MHACTLHTIEKMEESGGRVGLVVSAEVKKPHQKVNKTLKPHMSYVERRVPNAEDNLCKGPKNLRNRRVEATCPR